jgi:hypothetical protein
VGAPEIAKGIATACRCIAYAIYKHAIIAAATANPNAAAYTIALQNLVDATKLARAQEEARDDRDNA